MRWARLICRMPVAIGALIASVGAAGQPAAPPSAESAPAPGPRIDGLTPADWIFAFKLNAATASTTATLGNCTFGGAPKSYHSSQHYVVASSLDPQLRDGPGLVGTGSSDPVGATFELIYQSDLSFVVWNDQFYRHPNIAGCSDSCGGPWGHSKGIIAWDALGQGVVLQVTTPSWPGSGTQQVPRDGDGNTLGCVNDDDVKASQHFFSVRLAPADTAAVLDALENASVVTDIANPQLARIGGPESLAARARRLGHKSASTTPLDVVLSTGIRLISKPSALHVPPWQFLSARLGGLPLRTATWWASPRLPTTEIGRAIICWRNDLGSPGRVEVALTGRWGSQPIGLKGGPQDDANHAKIGASLDPAHPYAVFGDLNQQGRLTGKCDSSQNGRGGMFFVVENAVLRDAIAGLVSGATAATTVPSAKRSASGKHSGSSRHPLK
jgi:hypothetical protein